MAWRQFAAASILLSLGACVARSATTGNIYDVDHNRDPWIVNFHLHTQINIIQCNNGIVFRRIDVTPASHIELHVAQRMQILIRSGFNETWSDMAEANRC